MKMSHALTAAGATAVLSFGATAAYAHPGPSGVPFKSAGTGTETSLSVSDCQNIGTHDCTVESTGTAISSHMGTGPYVSDLTVHWATAYTNGAGGYCARADGTGTITAANGDTLTQSDSGTVCEVGATGTHVPHTFNGTFTNTGGTGRFATASGSGTVTGGDDGYGNSNYQETGTISY